MTITFTVHGKPAQQGSKRAFVVKHKSGKHRAVLTEDNAAGQRQWYNAVAQCAAEAMAGRPLITGAVSVSMDFRFCRPKSHYGSGKNSGTLKGTSPIYHAQKPDLSKIVRNTEDAMSGVVYVDDSQIIDYGDTDKRWCDRSQPHGATITVREIQGNKR